MNAMSIIKEMFETLQNTSSLNQKKELLGRYANSQLFRETLSFLLDGSVVTGISSKKLNKKVKPVFGVNPIFLSNKVVSWYGCMKYLKENNTGSDEDIYWIQNFLNSEPEKLRDFYSQLITKSLKIGCDSKVVNQAIPNLIPTFDVMLGTSIEKCKLKGTEWISISQKLNGNRCVFYNGELWTRQGKKYKNLDHIINELKKIYDTYEFYDTVLDGELIYDKPENMTDSEAFQIGTGLANSNELDKTKLKYVVFDKLTKEEFDNKKSNKKYSERKQDVLKFKEMLVDHNLKSIDVVPMFYSGTDHSRIMKWLNYAEEHDMEGVMLNLDTPYECKRTKNLIKVKKFFDIDLRCTGLQNGEGKYANTLGYILCEYEGNLVACGSGFTDEQRNYYWANPNEIVGKTVTIKYKEKTKNKEGKSSLQFPVFVTVRFDK